MIRGLYTAASGMLATIRRMESVTNNLANAQTPGFKQEVTAAGTFAQQLVYRLNRPDGAQQLGPLTLSTIAAAPLIDFSQGPLQQTGRPLDFALAGPGFFAVQTPEGVRYTRDGSFALDEQGRLVTATGALVLGDQGPIQLPGGNVSVTPEGVIEVDGAPMARLQVVEFGPDQVLERVGNNQLVPQDAGAVPTPAAATTVRQGMIEASNVDLTASLTTSLELQRAYDANQRLIQTMDEMVGRAVNDVGRPAS